MAERRGSLCPPAWHIVSVLHLPLSHTHRHTQRGRHGTNHPHIRSKTLRGTTLSHTHKCQAKWQRPSIILLPFTAALSHPAGGEWRLKADQWCQTFTSQYRVTCCDPLCVNMYVLDVTSIFLSVWTESYLPCSSFQQTVWKSTCRGLKRNVISHCEQSVTSRQQELSKLM